MRMCRLFADVWADAEKGEGRPLMRRPFASFGALRWYLYLRTWCGGAGIAESLQCTLRTWRGGGVLIAIMQPIARGLHGRAAAYLRCTSHHSVLRARHATHRREPAVPMHHGNTEFQCRLQSSAGMAGPPGRVRGWQCSSQDARVRLPHKYRPVVVCQGLS